MRNFFKNIFKASATQGAVQIEDPTSYNTLTSELNDISEDLFTLQTPPERLSSLNTEHEDELKPLNKFDELLSRDHHSSGYTDGYEHQDVELLTTYKSLLISEAVDILANALIILDMKILELSKFDNLSSDLNQTLKSEINKISQAHDIKRQHLLDKLESTSDGRGSIFRAVKSYETGFTRGFVDRSKIDDLGKTFNY